MTVALVLSGGCGSRLGSNIPKQYIRVGNQLIITYVLKVLANYKQIDAIQIVASERWYETILREIDNLDAVKDKFKGFSMPGETRQLSILSGLESIKSYSEDDSWVLIHDAARPLLSSKLLDDCFETVAGHDGVLPVLPMKDTIYYSENRQKVTALLDRTKIYAGQAPEVFRLDKYIHANRALLPEKILNINGSTEPAIMAGMDIALIPGDENNFKITTQADLEHFEQLVAKERND